MKTLSTTLIALAIAAAPLSSLAAGVPNYYYPPCEENDLLRGGMCINRDYILFEQENIGQQPRQTSTQVPSRRFHQPTDRTVEMPLLNTNRNTEFQKSVRERQTGHLVPRSRPVRILRVMSAETTGNEQIRTDEVRTKRAINSDTERIRLRR